MRDCSRSTLRNLGKMENWKINCFPPGGDGFITSQANVDPRPPIKLKDAEVSPEHRTSFEGLCKEFADVFSQDSGNLGKMPLMRMEIPTGDNPPISQRPYGLALKHVQWVHRRNRNT